MTAIAEFNTLDNRLKEHYETQDERDLWWCSPHPQLDGVAAAIALARGRGDEVAQIIDRLDAGAFL